MKALRLIVATVLGLALVVAFAVCLTVYAGILWLRGDE